MASLNTCQQPQKSTQNVRIYIFFFLISKLSSIKTNMGQALEYIESIQRKENEEERRKGTYTNHPKQKRLEETREYTQTS